MAVFKQIKGSEFYLYMNGALIYKKWLTTGQSVIFDTMAYDRYTHLSITDFDVQAMADVFEVKAKLKMLSTAEGGRQTPIATKYRPNHVFEYKNGQIVRTFIGQILLDGIVQLSPGAEAIVTIQFLLSQPIEPFLEIGRIWWIHEGARKVGEAEILTFSNT